LDAIVGWCPPWHLRGNRLIVAFSSYSSVVMTTQLS
jgi:hypothetical protein